MSKTESTTQADKAPPAVTRQKVRLAKPHTHRGRPYAAGEEIELRPDQVARLRAAGVVAD